MNEFYHLKLIKLDYNTKYLKLNLAEFSKKPQIIFADVKDFSWGSVFYDRA